MRHGIFYLIFGIAIFAAAVIQCVRQTRGDDSETGQGKLITAFDVSEERIVYALSQSEYILLEVYDLSGRRLTIIDHGPKAAGLHVVYWDYRDNTGYQVANGNYQIRLQVDYEVRSKEINVLNFR